MRLPLYRLSGTLKVTNDIRECQAVSLRRGENECNRAGGFLATVICKTCGLRELFVCSMCLGELMRVIDLPGRVCCKEQSPRHEVVALTHARPVLVGKF